MRKTAAVVVALALVSGTALADGDGGPVETEERSPVWLGTFVASSVMVIGGISIYAYGAHRVDDEAEQIRLGGVATTISDSDCDTQSLRDMDGHFDAACRWNKRTRYAALTTLVMVPVAIVSGYLAFREMPKKEKRGVAFVPTVTTESAGAMLDVRW
ncbi:MAG: hypothetical protein AB7T06_28920 [Kofleriaceae bacterium]